MEEKINHSRQGFNLHNGMAHHSVGILMGNVNKNGNDYFI